METICVFGFGYVLGGISAVVGMWFFYAWLRGR
jgi:hypothetical protein